MPFVLLSALEVKNTKGSSKFKEWGCRGRADSNLDGWGNMDLQLPCFVVCFSVSCMLFGSTNVGTRGAGVLVKNLMLLVCKPFRPGVCKWPK